MAVTRAGVARLDFDDLVGQDGDILHFLVTDAAFTPFQARLDRATTDGPEATTGVPVEGRA